MKRHSGTFMQHHHQMHIMMVMTTTKTMVTTKVATMTTEAARSIRAPVIWIAIAMKAVPVMATMITMRW